MAQTPLAASVHQDRSSSGSSQKTFGRLMKKGTLPLKRKASSRQQPPENAAHISKDPHGEPGSRITLRKCTRELDEQLKVIETEIQDLLEFWEHSFTDGKQDASPRIRWISKWHLGHPLDMNDQGLREDPDYNEEQVEREALQDYQQELEEQRVRATCKQPASQKQGRAASCGTAEESPSSSLEGPTTLARASASLSPGRLPALENPYCTTGWLSITTEAELPREKVQGESESPSDSTEEDTILPKRNLRCRVVGSREVGKDHQQQPVTDQSCEKLYSFRRRNKSVSYVSQQEEEERSWSEASGGNDWSPGKEGSGEDEDGEEEEAPEEDPATESGEQLAVEAGPAQAELQRKDLKKRVRSYSCPKCSRVFSNSSNMRKHLRIHDGIFPYGCHACGKSYADSSTLAKHQQTHTGKRPHQCPTCPKAFYVKRHLDDHIRRHKDIRPFACLECKSSFYSQISLLTHMNIHVEGSNRPQTLVRCEECNKTFTSRRHLQQHRKRHKNLWCEFCTDVSVFGFKNRFHRRLHLHGICPRCGLLETEVHLCEGPAQNAEHPQRAAPRFSVAVPQGVGADRPLGTATPPRGPKQPISATQVVSESSGAKKPSFWTSSPFLYDEQVGPSDFASPLKELSRLVQATVAMSPQDRLSAPFSRPVLDNRGPRPSNLAQVPLQLNPAGALQNTPAARPVQPSPAAAQPLPHMPSLPKPSGPVELPPFSQDLVTFPGSAAASHSIVLVTDPPTTSPRRLTRPLGSDLVRGTVSNDWIMLNPATLPVDTKDAMEIPSQRIEHPPTFQICAACQTRYVGKHVCWKLPQDPAERREEEPKQNTRVWQQPPPVYSSYLQVQNEKETLAKSCSLRQSNPQMPYAQSGGKEPESGMKGDSEFRWAKRQTSGTQEVESPKASECPSVPFDNQQTLRQTERGKGCYMCKVCDKHFDYWRTFKSHACLHQAFSCDMCDASFPESEQLKWHRRWHFRKTTA